MKKASLLLLLLAVAVGPTQAADRPYSPAAIRARVPFVSVVTPAYYYDYKTRSSATASTGSVVVASVGTASSAASAKSASSIGTKTTPSFGATTTIYAAIRTDGVAGSGTRQNPYDAGTEAKFDAILANLLKGDGAQRTTLSLAAGTYTVTPARIDRTTANPGGYVSNIPGNLEITGAGEDKTIIRAGIVPTGSSTYWMFAAIELAPGGYFDNLTLDCNIQNQTAPKVTIDGIQFIHVGGGATHTLASHVHIIDGGNHPNDPGDSEWFGIQFSDGTPGSVAEITKCAVDHYQGNSGCTVLYATDLITNNTVTLNSNDPDNISGHGGGGGFQNALGPGGTVSGNVCKQCTFGLYTDLDDQSDENIENNVFDAVYGGVWIYTWDPTTTIQKIYVHNNTITKTYSAAVILGNPSTRVVNSDLYIYNNNITTNVSSTLGGDNLINLYATQNSEVFGNTFSISPGAKSLPTNIALINSNLSTIAWYNNKFGNGTVIPSPVGTVDHALSTASIPAN